MDKPVRVVKGRPVGGPGEEIQAHYEWLVTNGLGGYASGTVDGMLTRRHHGILIAALPFGRTMMLNGLAERVRLPDRTVLHLGSGELLEVKRETIAPVTEFRLEWGLPVWIYQFGEFTLEKRIVLPYRQNTAHVQYQLLAGNG